MFQKSCSPVDNAGDRQRDGRSLKTLNEPPATPGVGGCWRSVRFSRAGQAKPPNYAGTPNYTHLRFHLVMEKCMVATSGYHLLSTQNRPHALMYLKPISNSRTKMTTRQRSLAAQSQLNERPQPVPWRSGCKPCFIKTVIIIPRPST